MTQATTGLQTWHLYLLECSNGAFYAGITNNLDKRYVAHCKGRGAKYTRANPPIRILASAALPDRSAAAKAEWMVKQLKRKDKINYIEQLAMSA